MKVSACVMTLNEEKYVWGLLDGLLDYVDEIVVLDGGSTDRTVDVCGEFTDKIVVRPSQGWPEPDRDYCMRMARNRWVLFMDADERASPHLLNALDILTNRGYASGFWIPRRNYYAPYKYYRHIHYPDFQLRLFDRTVAKWPSGLHASPEIRGDCTYLYEPYHIRHLRPIYSDPGKYRRWVEIQAGSRPIHFPPVVYRAMAPLRYAATLSRDLAGGCLLDGPRGLFAAHNHALYGFWEYLLIGDRTDKNILVK